MVALRSMHRDFPGAAWICCAPGAKARGTSGTARAAGPATPLGRLWFLKLDFIPVDKHVAKLWSPIEQITASDYQVGDLACLQGPELIAGAKNLRCIGGQSLESRVFGQAALDSFANVTQEIGRTESGGCKCEFHTGGRHLRRACRRLCSFSQHSKRLIDILRQIGRALWEIQ